MHRILLVGGGTGGHIYPLVAVARELQRITQEKGVDLELMATSDDQIWQGEFGGIKFKKISAPKLRRYQGNLNFLEFFKAPVALLQALWHIFIFMPDLVFLKGGYVSQIPFFIAKLYFIPVFVHESDTIPGLSVKVISKFAKKVFISFESTRQYFKNKEVILSGNPIRKELSSGDRNEALKIFNLSPDKKTILVLGGSQGAKAINDLVINGLVLLAGRYQIIHQAGFKNFEYVNSEVEKIKKEGEKSYGKNIETNYRVFTFMNEEGLKNAYAAADLIVSRAGANAIFEIAALGKPAIIIPIAYSASNHQKMNAQEFVKAGAVVLEEQNLSPAILLNQIEHLLKPENYFEISRKIKQFSNLESAKKIAQEIFDYVNR